LCDISTSKVYCSAIFVSHEIYQRSCTSQATYVYVLSCKRTHTHSFSVDLMKTNSLLHKYDFNTKYKLNFGVERSYMERSYMESRQVNVNKVFICPVVETNKLWLFVCKLIWSVHLNGLHQIPNCNWSGHLFAERRK
jgi:hypothetical protein